VLWDLDIRGKARPFFVGSDCSVKFESFLRVSVAEFFQWVQLAEELHSSLLVMHWEGTQEEDLAFGGIGGW
jgi:hypothetical protein